MSEGLRARVEARRGRQAVASEVVRELERRIGIHPALWRTRGDAYAHVWDWDIAARAYDSAARLSPRDTQAWRDLAGARGSAGDPKGSLKAAVKGLAGNPRDEALLRSQALALQALDADATAATAAWHAHRVPDSAAALGRRCEQQVPGCRTARLPVPVIQTRSVVEPTP